MATAAAAEGFAAVTESGRLEIGANQRQRIVDSSSRRTTMYTLEIAIAAAMLFALLRITSAVSRRHERRQRALSLRHSYVDDRDSLARFHRIVGK